MGLLQADKLKREVTKPLQKPNMLVNVTKTINIKGKKGYHRGWESHRQVGLLGPENDLRKTAKEKTGELRKRNQSRHKRLGWENPNEQESRLTPGYGRESQALVPERVTGK